VFSAAVVGAAVGCPASGAGAVCVAAVTADCVLLDEDESDGCCATTVTEARSAAVKINFEVRMTFSPSFLKPMFLQTQNVSSNLLKTVFLQMSL
jgi:hypothetical protein